MVDLIETGLVSVAGIGLLIWSLTVPPATLAAGKVRLRIFSGAMFIVFLAFALLAVDSGARMEPLHAMLRVGASVAGLVASIIVGVRASQVRSPSSPGDRRHSVPPAVWALAVVVLLGGDGLVVLGARAASTGAQVAYVSAGLVLAMLAAWLLARSWDRRRAA